ncbi:MAG: hypothetical protein EBE86_009240 [Hormoscilla sp. GUM202]|nr:hypothetical protein [Hormoscilla sp. GUM202]
MSNYLPNEMQIEDELQLTNEDGTVVVEIGRFTATLLNINSGDLDQLKYELNASLRGVLGLEEGEEGQEILTGTVAPLKINGQEGDDTINGGEEDDTINGGEEDDTIYGDDTINGGEEDDIINGGEGDDTINGGERDDTIYGGEGDDILSGGGGRDELIGGGGADIFKIELDAGHFTTIHDFTQGEDRIAIEGTLGTDFLVSRRWEWGRFARLSGPRTMYNFLSLPDGTLVARIGNPDGELKTWTEIVPCPHDRGICFYGAFGWARRNIEIYRQDGIWISGDDFGTPGVGEE